MCIPVCDYHGDYVDKTLLIQACNLVEQSVKFLDFDDKKDRVCPCTLKVVCLFVGLFDCLFVYSFVCLFVFFCLFVCLFVLMTTTHATLVQMCLSTTSFI